jgi:peptide/nickel transport system substrate-binding protein
VRKTQTHWSDRFATHASGGDPRRRVDELSRRRLFGWGLSGGLALTASGLLVACGDGTPSGTVTGEANTPAGDPQRGGILRVAWQGEPTGPNGGLDPQTCTSNCYPVHQHVWDTLVRVDYDLNPKPLLAESWTPSPDGKTWTFKLRGGITHHHGTPFTSADVVHTFKRILDPQTGSVVRTVLSFIEDIEAPDERTVVFHLQSPNADLPTLIAMPQTSILPRDRSDEQLRREPVGTGPFRFKEYGRGERIVLLRNPDYWQQGLPYLDELHYFLMPEQSARIAALTGGRVDMIGEVSPEMVAPLSQPGVRVEVVPSGNVNLIAMQMDKEPFTDNRVRTAFKLVADRETIEQAVLSGTGSLGNDHPFPKNHPFYDQTQVVKTQDIARAKRLLTEAGHPNGLDLTLHLNADRPDYRSFALAYQEQAKAAGINLRLQHHPDATYWNDIYRQVPLYMSGWNFRPSPDELVSIMFHSEARWNEANVKSPELDSMILAARGETDPEKRKQLYFDIQHWVSENVGVVMPIFRSTISAVRDNVQGYRVHPIPWYLFHTTWLKR